MTTLHDTAWRFAPTGDGVLYGYNNAGTEHFKQDPIGKLVRETVQNSLDAHQDGLPPVTVDVYECDIAAEQIGATSLKPHLEQARARTTVTGQVDGQKDYRKALILSRGKRPSRAWPSSTETLPGYMAGSGTV